MKSKIMVKYDRELKEPFLEIIQDKQSDVLADDMLDVFIQTLNYSHHTVYTQFPDNALDNNTIEIRISENPPEHAVYKRIDNMKDWARQFFQEGDAEPFNAFFNALSAKASLVTINKKLPAIGPQFRTGAV